MKETKDDHIDMLDFSHQPEIFASITNEELDKVIFETGLYGWGIILFKKTESGKVEGKHVPNTNVRIEYDENFPRETDS